MSEALEAKRKVLAGATLMWAAAWEAIKADGRERDPKGLAELEALVRAGKATIGIYLERDADKVFLAAAIVQAGAEPFENTVLKIRGPVVASIEQLQALELQAPGVLH